MRPSRTLIWILAAALVAGAVLAAAQSRVQALAALAQPDAPARLAGVQRLAEIGSIADADRVLAAAAVWQIWGRSGDPKIDQLFARGLAQMQTSALGDALATFSDIVLRKPAFAEGWNKRATVYFLLGENEKSLQDCAEVFKRNPRHFGALSGAGQIHLQLGNLRAASEQSRSIRIWTGRRK